MPTRARRLATTQPGYQKRAYAPRVLPALASPPQEEQAAPEPRERVGPGRDDYSGPAAYVPLYLTPALAEGVQALLDGIRRTPRLAHDLGMWAARMQRAPEGPLTAFLQALLVDAEG